MSQTYEKNGKVFWKKDDTEVNTVCELLKCFPTAMPDEYYVVTTRGTGTMHLTKENVFYLMVGGDDLQISN